MVVSVSGTGISNYETLEGTVQLYLLRHGIAEAKAASGRDVDRCLTPSGIASLRDALQRVRAAACKPDVIISSPYLRALETARIAAECLGYSGDLLQSPALCPEASPSGLWEEASLHAPAEAVLLVAHEPLLSAAVSWLLGETRVVTTFGPATMVRIDVEKLGARPQAVFKWKLEA